MCFFLFLCKLVGSHSHSSLYAAEYLDIPRYITQCLLEILQQLIEAFERKINLNALKKVQIVLTLHVTAFENVK